jgi:hypothetical protein
VPLLDDWLWRNLHDGAVVIDIVVVHVVIPNCYSRILGGDSRNAIVATAVTAAIAVAVLGQSRRHTDG